MTEESAPPKLPLFDKIEDINNPSSNFIDIFGIDTTASVKDTLKNLTKLQLLYHTDKCSESNGYTTEEVQKCETIFKKITEIKETFNATQSYDFLRSSLPPTQIKPVSKSLVELSQDITDITDVNDQIQQITFHINLLKQLY
jgi:preprotein translocase subunit Sec63